jgi:hypothetical protein
MHWHYTAYGLTIAADLPLPNLRPLAEAPTSVDVSILSRAAPPAVSAWQPHPRFVSRRPQDQNGSAWLTIWTDERGGCTRLRYGDGVEFIIAPDARTLWMHIPPHFSTAYAETYLLNQGFGFIMRLRGQTCLHASAVCIDGEAVLFSAPSGYGKSTLAAYFALRHQHPVITDDIAPLFVQGDAVWVKPGYPRLRLTPESAEAFFGRDHALQLTAEDWDKFYLPLHDAPEAGHFSTQPLRVRAVYLLRTWGDQPTIAPLAPAGALRLLMDNTYLNYLMDKTVYAADFAVISHLSSSAAVRAIDGYPGLAQLDLTYRAIMDDLRRL